MFYSRHWRADAHEANNSSHLDGGENELGFTIASDAEKINDGNHEQEYRDEDGFAETGVPVFDCQRAGDDFQRQRNKPL